MKRTPLPLFALIILSAFFSGCKKDNSAPLLVHSFTVESIIAPGGGQSTTNKCFINLYEGIAYTKAEAELQSSKVDFAYNYRGPGCDNCRLFENVETMYSRTRYVESFSTITASTMRPAEKDSILTVAEFDAIKTASDIDRIFADLNYTFSRFGDITNGFTDAAVNRVFVFKDKDGRKGVFKIGDYIANVPGGIKPLCS